MAFTAEEISAIKTFFAPQIKSGNVPSWSLVEAGQNKYAVLNQRLIPSIRSKVHLLIKQKLKTQT